LPAGVAADDGAALVFDGTELHEVVASRAHAAAYRVGCRQGQVVGERMAARYLGEPGDQAAR
jgi:dipeptidase E